MRTFCLISVICMWLATLSLTIPIWITTLGGGSRYMVVLDSVLGRFEQIGDLIIITTVSLLGLITILILLGGREL